MVSVDKAPNARETYSFVAKGKFTLLGWILEIPSIITKNINDLSKTEISKIKNLFIKFYLLKCTNS
jgi:hypothetical protein